MRLIVVMRSIAQRFALPLLVVVSAVMIVLGKADTLLFDRTRAFLADAAAPVLEFVAAPVSHIDGAVQSVRSVFSIHDENARLREENARLLRWQQTAQTLAAENERLKELLKLAPDPALAYVSTRVIANSGDTYARSVLVNAGRRDGIVRGQAAITGEGLVGRIAEVGERASRVLLITDINSHIPVLVESTRERAILSGNNADQPKLEYLPPRATVKIGDRIVTSGHGGVFPPGLPVGVIAAMENGLVTVEPFVELSRLDFVRVVDYGLSGVLPQPVVPIIRAGKGKKGAADVPAEDAR